uniref:Uncharacterized protein n=1 Tax=Spermophilus dauricus TaxID=99837 RepID=A0A8C9URY8_SPEDA
MNIPESMDMLYVFKNNSYRWCMPVILAIWEAETRRITSLKPISETYRDPYSVSKIKKDWRWGM